MGKRSFQECRGFMASGCFNGCGGCWGTLVSDRFQIAPSLSSLDTNSSLCSFVPRGALGCTACAFARRRIHHRKFATVKSLSAETPTQTVVGDFSACIRATARHAEIFSFHSAQLWHGAGRDAGRVSPGVQLACGESHRVSKSSQPSARSPAIRLGFEVNFGLVCSTCTSLLFSWQAAA